MAIWECAKGKAKSACMCNIEFSQTITPLQDPEMFINRVWEYIWKAQT